MLELSWDGLVAHTDAGYNIGKPPYGYLAEVTRHPVPAKAAEGLVKRRLVPDPARASAVTQIFTWRATEHLSYEKIAERLNLDLDRYPPPQPVAGRGRRAVGRWTGGAVREILCNPKYTGYMVYNRRKRSRPERNVAGRVNPPAEWVWSSKPTHEPLTTRRLFEAGTVIGRSNRGTRQSPGPNRHPATKRTFRPDRQALLDQGQAVPSDRNDPTVARRAALETKIKELERQQTNVINELQTYRSTGDDDIDQQWRAQLRATFADLATQRRVAQSQLTAVTHPPTPATEDPTLLDQLPVVELDLAALPEDLQRQLFDAFQLQIWYHHPSRRVGLRVTINADTGRRLAAFPGNDAHDQHRPRPPAPATTARPTATTTGQDGFSLALCAPGRSQNRPAPPGTAAASNRIVTKHRQPPCTQPSVSCIRHGAVTNTSPVASADGVLLPRHTLGSTCTSREWDGIERRIWSVGHQVEVDADRPPAVFDSVYRSEPCRPDPRPFGVSLPTTDRSDWACVDRRRGPSSTRLGHLCACARVHRDPGR